MEGNNDKLELFAKWNGKEYPVVLSPSDTIQELKRQLEMLTNVQPKRQKLMGLCGGKIPADDVAICSLNLKHKHKFIMMGTVEQTIAAAIERPAECPEIFDDFEFDYVASEDEVKQNVENRNKLKKMIEIAEITVIHPPRPNKKLLVLDLDYTILDCKHMSQEGINLLDYKRPYLDEFLAICHKEYDIVVWSQTHWKWLEIKLTELGMLTHPHYHISFVLDRTLMFTVTTSDKYKKREHEVKALEIIWSKFPQYNKHNTIHIDDLSRNFAMNPKNGLKIVPFKNALETRRADTVLLHLAKYLMLIANHNDLSSLDHDNWEKHLQDKRNM
jgi:ubiquitin-like domain-containing CTD phosphatase 1